MKVTKDKNRIVIEISGEELRKHNLTYSLLDCRNIHTRNTINRIFLEAMGERLPKSQEIYLLPDLEEGCVIVFKEKEKTDFDSVSFSVLEFESEVFSGFFS